MSRRRRTRNRRRRKSPNYWLILVQVVVLSGVLVFLFLFRDYLALSASNVMNSLSGTGGDLEVPANEDEAKNEPPAGQPKNNDER